MNIFSTFVCPTELVALDKRLKEFKDIGAEIIGISTDSQYSHLAWMNLQRNVSWYQFYVIVYSLKIIFRLKCIFFKNFGKVNKNIHKVFLKRNNCTIVVL